MRQWAVVANNVVVDRFAMASETVDEYRDGRRDPNPAWPSGVAFLDVTGVTPSPTFGWTISEKGWAPPAPPAPVVDPNQAQRQADDDFVAQMLDKVRNNRPLTQVERDRLTVLQLSRGV